MRPRSEFEEVDRWIRWGLNDCQIARLTGLNRRTVCDWRRRPAPPGSSPRGAGSGCCVCHRVPLNEPAYGYLLGLYLGDGHISACPRGVFKLRITLDTRYPGIITEAKDAIAEVRALGSIGQVPKIGCVEIYSYWKHWPCLFPQHGAGPKHLRPIRLAPWQASISTRHPDRLLRGLIHSDGYRALNSVNGKGYPRYQFSNRSADILAIFCRACEDFGVRWRRMKAFAISVARAPDVAKLDTAIGPKR
jgi:hypothetical protein